MARFYEKSLGAAITPTEQEIESAFNLYIPQPFGNPPEVLAQKSKARKIVSILE